MSEEPLQTEEPEVVEPEVPEIDVEAFSQELAKFQVKSPNELAGKLAASEQAGRLGNMLGEERNKNAQLEAYAAKIEAELKSIKADIGGIKRGDSYGEDDIDIGAMIEEKATNAVRNVVRDEIIGPQQRYMSEISSIRGDDDYQAVGEVFEQHLASPQVQQLLQSGRTTPKAEYDKTKIMLFKTMLGKASETITHLNTNKKPPNIEGGEQTAVFSPSVDDEKQTQLKNMVKPENWKGTNDDLQKMISTYLG